MNKDCPTGRIYLDELEAVSRMLRLGLSREVIAQSLDLPYRFIAKSIAATNPPYFGHSLFLEP